MFATDGVTLSLNEANITNNSYVDVRDIGDTDENALLCHTDKLACCTGGHKAGEWYYPNRTAVQFSTDTMSASLDNYFYRDRGQSVVRLKRVGNPHQRGLFWCEVITRYNGTQTIFVNIGMSNK